MTSSLAPSVVTNRDPKGLKFVSVVEAAYNGARLSDEEAQRVNDASGLGDLIGMFITENRRTNRFANEEVRSTYVYPPEYRGPKPIEEQIAALAAALHLDTAGALEYAQNLPDLSSFVPEDALPFVDWFAIPRFNQLDTVLEEIAKSRRFCNYRSEQMDRFRVHERTARFLVQIEETQHHNEILIIAAQLGMRHRGRSVRRARETFVGNEFGLTPVMGGAITLVHPERFVRWEQLHMDLPGGEFDDPGSDVRFVHAPLLLFSVDGVKFAADRVVRAHGRYGSASVFLPPPQ